MVATAPAEAEYGVAAATLPALSASTATPPVALIVFSNGRRSAEPVRDRFRSLRALQARSLMPEMLFDRSVAVNGFIEGEYSEDCVLLTALPSAFAASTSTPESIASFCSKRVNSSKVERMGRS